MAKNTHHRRLYRLCKLMQRALFSGRTDRALLFQACIRREKARFPGEFEELGARRREWA